jgi:hypothetical protein
MEPVRLAYRTGSSSLFFHLTGNSPSTVDRH